MLEKRKQLEEQRERLNTIRQWVQQIPSDTLRDIIYDLFPLGLENLKQEIEELYKILGLGKDDISPWQMAHPTLIRALYFPSWVLNGSNRSEKELFKTYTILFGTYCFGVKEKPNYQDDPHKYRQEMLGAFLEEQILNPRFIDFAESLKKKYGLKWYANTWKEHIKKFNRAEKQYRKAEAKRQREYYKTEYDLNSQIKSTVNIAHMYYERALKAFNEMGGELEKGNPSSVTAFLTFLVILQREIPSPYIMATGIRPRSLIADLPYDPEANLEALKKLLPHINAVRKKLGFEEPSWQSLDNFSNFIFVLKNLRKLLEQIEQQERPSRELRETYLLYTIFTTLSPAVNYAITFSQHVR